MSKDQNLFDAQVRHSVYLQRLSNGRVRELDKFINQLRASILARLGDDINDISRTQLRARLAVINSVQSEILNSYLGQLQLDLDGIAVGESEFEQRLLARTLNTDVASLSESALFSAINNRPLAGSTRSGKLLKSFMSDWKKSQMDLVTGIIRQGYAEGQGVASISASLRSAINGQTKRSSQALIRTSINHISQQARNALWAKNKDLIQYWRFVAVLDSRTTQECASIASLNKVYKVGSGPYPPRHVNCRSTTMAVIDKNDSPDDMNYFQWLKTQPKGFVRDQLGVEKGDLLLSNKLSAEEFAKFGLNKRFKPLTLKEMKEKDKRLNLDLFPDG